MADLTDFFRIHSFDFGSGSDSGDPRTSPSPAIGPSDFSVLGSGLPSEGHDVSCDWTGDEFFIGRRNSGAEPTCEFSRSRLIDSEGVRVFGFDSDSDEQIVAIGSDPDPSPIPITLCWDCLRIDDDDDNGDAESSEWEIYDEAENSVAVQEEEGNWEVLEEGLPYTSDYDDVLFAQFQEQAGPAKCGPPAAKSAVEALPAADVAGSPVDCAVCKDGISVGEKAKELPCRHCYHEECILPWLGMRNTCPLCRHELPTDDAEYESRKARREEDEEVEERISQPKCLGRSRHELKETRRCFSLLLSEVLVCLKLELSS